MNRHTNNLIVGQGLAGTTLAWRLLETGMVLTVEPGLYIPAAEDVEPRWHNIGIRIEDDVLVTRKGREILTGDVPKEPAEVEALMAEGMPG